MPKKLKIDITESLENLRYLQKNQTTLSRISRIKALILIKEKKAEYIKDLSSQLNYSRQSIRKWLLLYKAGGIKSFLNGNYKRIKHNSINSELQKAIKEKLEDLNTTTTSYVELLDWVVTEQKTNINYSTLYYHCRKHQHITLKVARKSHHKKDDEAVELFKKLN